VFPPGAKVYVDGRDLARVRQAFPEGSSSFMFPHYKVDFLDGDKNVAVAMSRVGVVKRDQASGVRRQARGRRDPARAPSPYETLYIVQGNYGYGGGWEDLTQSTSYKEARTDLRAYNENEGAPHRLVTRRVHKETGQPYRRPVRTGEA
jgi:hypothetical protein